MSAPSGADEHTREESAFWLEVHRLMDEKGIEDLEALYGRFMDQEPPRIRAKWTLERFRRHVNHEVDDLNPAFLWCLEQALDASDDEGLGLYRAWFEDISTRARYLPEWR
jgi:hypothetical protein